MVAWAPDAEKRAGRDRRPVLDRRLAGGSFRPVLPAEEPLAYLLAPLASAALLFGSAHLLGERLAGWLRLDLQGRAERFAVAGTLGLGALGLAGMAIASLGLLRPVPILTLLVLPVIFSLARRAPAAPAKAAGPHRARDSWVRRAAILAIALLAAANLVRAMFPPTGFDALNYQLPAVARYLAEGRIGYPADLRFAAGPALVPVLFALVAATGGDLACQLVSFGTGLLLAAAAAALAGRLWGRTAAALAAMVLYATPVVGWLSAEAYVDLGLALCCTLALHGAVARLRGGGLGWAAFGGIAAGLGLGIRYLAAVPAALLLLDLASAPARSGGARRRIAGVAVFVAALVATASPWYVRNVRETGNPVFPLWNQVFDGRHWTAEDEAEHELYLRQVGPGRTLWDLLKAPLRLTFSPSAFGASAGTGIGFAYLLLLPLVPLLRPPGLETILLAAHAGGLFASWFLTSQQTRFLVPALAPAAVLAGGAVACLLREDGIETPRLRRALLAMCLIVAVSGGTRWPGAPPPLGADARAAYLRIHVAGYARVEEVNRLLPRGAVLYAFGEEGRRYYYSARALGDWFGPAAYRRFLPGDSDRDVWTGWRRLGVTHVLLRDDFLPRGMRAFREHPFWWERLVPLGAWGTTRLYRIQDPPPEAGSPPPATG